MKPYVGVLALVFCVVPSLAQAPSSDSISIGDFGEVQLYLGMSKESALRILRENFDVVDEAGGEDAILSKGSVAAGKVGVEYGWVSFNGGSVASVTKVWGISGDDKGAVVRAIRGAMASFGSSARGCNVTTFYHQEPTSEKTGVEVSCGRRHVQIVTIKLNSANGSREDIAVNEVLGNAP